MRLLSTLLLLTLFSFVCLAKKPSVVVSTGHNGFINSLHVSPDGKWVASGGNDKLVKIMDLSSGKEFRTFHGNDGRVNYIRFSPNSKFLGAMINSNELKIWDISNGKLIRSIPASGSIPKFEFSQDGEEVYFVNEYNQIAKVKWQSSADPTSLVTDGIVRIQLSADKKSIFYLDYKGGLTQISIADGSVLQTKTLFDKFVYPFAEMSIDHKGEFLAVAFNDKKVRIYKTSDLSLHTTFNNFKALVTALTFDQQSQTLITTQHDNQVRTWNVKGKKETAPYPKASLFAPTALSVHPTEKLIFFNDNNKINIARLGNGKVIKQIKAKGNKIINLAYDQQGTYLAAATGDITIKLWNLKENKINTVLPGFFPVLFTPNGKQLVSMETAMSMAVWDMSTRKKAFTLATEGELMQNLAFSSDGKYISGAGYQGIIRIWDFNTKKIVHRLSGHQGGIYGTSFSPDGKYLASCGMDQTVRIWDLSSGKEIKKIQDQTIIISDVKFSPNGQFLASAAWDKTINLYKTSDWSLSKTLKGHTNMITSISFNKSGDRLASSSSNNAVWSADNSVKIWDVASGTEVCSFQNHVGGIQKVIFDKTSDLVFSSGDDGMIKVWTYTDCLEMASLISVNKSDHVILTPDNYYTASRAALEGVAFRLDAALYPFEQFDLRLNRPDVVASKIGKTPQNLVNAYNYLYKKRLKRSGFTEEDLGTDFHLPKTELLTKDLPLITKENHVRFTIKAEDNLFPLDRLKVFVDDVPIYGVQGMNLKDRNSKSVEIELDVPLIPGPNNVQISALNSKGVESLRSSFDIVKDDSETKGNLYVISIGVSKYKDSRFDLTYPSKDATDIINELGNNKSLFKQIFTIPLTDEDVTKENISKLQERLKNIKPEDAVIFFIAGHGVLDDQFDYYFATHDMDFNDPKARGLSYDDLQQIIGSLKALKKLLIMDTCHSGEVDKDEVEKEKKSTVEQGDVKFRAVGEGIRQKEGFGVENANLLMQDLFADVRKGTGITVISSAGGAEFAMESAEWKNGLFTYCMLEGLKSNKADLNKDGEIVISEIRAYVYQQVSKLSNGKQKPTSRSENLLLDYPIH